MRQHGAQVFFHAGGSREASNPRVVCSIVWATVRIGIILFGCGPFGADTRGAIACLPAAMFCIRCWSAAPSVTLDVPTRCIGARAPRRRAFEACAMDDFYKDALKFGCLQVRPSCMPFVSAPGRRALSRAGAASASSHVANIPSRRPQTPPTSAQGFKHFSLYLRGREELLITVHHRDDPRAPDDPGPFPPNDAIDDRNGSASRCVSRARDAPPSPSRNPPPRPSVPR